MWLSLYPEEENCANTHFLLLPFSWISVQGFLDFIREEICVLVRNNLYFSLTNLANSGRCVCSQHNAAPEVKPAVKACRDLATPRPTALVAQSETGSVTGLVRWCVSWTERTCYSMVHDTNLFGGLATGGQCWNWTDCDDRCKQLSQYRSCTKSERFEECGGCPALMDHYQE